MPVHTGTHGRPRVDALLLGVRLRETVLNAFGGRAQVEMHALYFGEAFCSGPRGDLELFVVHDEIHGLREEVLRPLQSSAANLHLRLLHLRRAHGGLTYETAPLSFRSSGLAISEVTIL